MKIIVASEIDQKIIFHHNDADGRCAAFIAALAESKDGLVPEYFEMDYKDPVPYDQIHENAKIIIVDFSFKPDVMKEIEKQSKNIIWIDHHKTAEAYGYKYDGLRDFSSPGHSGCELAWKYYFKDKPMPEAVRLIGDYDTFRLSEGEKSKEYYEGVKIVVGNTTNKEKWNKLIETPVDEVVKLGKIGILYRNDLMESVAKGYGWETTIGGHKAFAMNTPKIGSGAFGKRFETYPICIAFIKSKNEYSVSLYSKSVDVGEICKKLGGGGHKGAAGFTCKELPF